MDDTAWKEFKSGAAAAVAQATAGLGEAGSAEGAAERHDKRQEALLARAVEILEGVQTKKAASKVAAKGHSKMSRLRAEARKWEGFRIAIGPASQAHIWFSGEEHRKEGRRIWKVKELREHALDPSISPRQRQLRMAKVATLRSAETSEELMRAQGQQADDILDEMTEAVQEGEEGGVVTALFRILNASLPGREDKVRARSSSEHATRSRPQVMMSSVYEDDDKAKGKVLSGATKVLNEVRKIMLRNTRAGHSFPGGAREMMAKLHPFPEPKARDPA